MILPAMEQQIKIHIQDKEKNEKDIYAEQGNLLFDVLIQNGISFKGNCGKKRACKACMVYFEEEQEWKKSCSYVLQEDISITISGLLEEENMVLLADSQKSVKTSTRKIDSISTKKSGHLSIKKSEPISTKSNLIQEQKNVASEDKIGAARDVSYGMAIDLGTTDRKSVV